MSSAASSPLRSSLVYTLAFGTAVSVAMLYLTQPLLPALGRDLRASTRALGLLVTFMQLGYAAGIFALVPLGDVVDQKKLILGKLAGLTAVLIGGGLARSIGELSLASFGIGVLATAAQDFVPLAATLAPAERRGRVIGTVMSGLLIGILLSRTFSGVVADHFGWRAVFFVSAALIVALIIGVVVLVPSTPKHHVTSYPALLRSMLTLLRTYPALGWSVGTQGIMGMIFSAFWTVLAFHLSRAPLALTTAQIGYFGLAGAAGAFAAPIAGRRADRRGPLANIPLAIAITAAAFVLLSVWPTSLLALVVGAAAFDLGVQMSMVSHQTIIYALDPTARSRINAIFVSGIFLFFALGSFLGTYLFNRFGWLGVVALCLADCALAYAVHRRLVRSLRRTDTRTQGPRSTGIANPA